MDRQTAIIIGAGAAGLMAARELANDYKVIILEAGAQPGGRIRTLTSHAAVTIEAGAEFIHGPLPLTLKLLKDAGIEYTHVQGKMYRKETTGLKELKDIIPGWDLLLRKMKSLDNDMTMHDFLEQYFSEDKYTDLRKQATAYTEGFDIADVKKVSVKALYKEWSEEEQDENFRIKGGYMRLIRYLQQQAEQKGVQLILNQAVKQIDWERENVTVYTTDTKYYSEKAIITVPLSILRKTADKASINFTPPLDEYIQAADAVGTGAVIKTVLQFRQPFWKQDTGFVFSDEIIPTWWTQSPDTIPVLTGWAGGTKAERLSDHSDDELLAHALLSLASIFDKKPEELKQNLLKGWAFNWQREELALGAYTYSMPGSDTARKILNLPVADTLFFAGEGLYEGKSPGTVEAALVSGKQTAEKCKILNVKSKM